MRLIGMPISQESLFYTIFAMVRVVEYPVDKTLFPCTGVLSTNVRRDSLISIDTEKRSYKLVKSNQYVLPITYHGATGIKATSSSAVGIALVPAFTSAITS